MTLPLTARAFAYRDISSLSGKTVEQVFRKAGVLKASLRASVALIEGAE